MPARVRLLLSVTAISFVFGTIGFWVTEHRNNPTDPGFGDAVWWWIVTTTTVGYGDVVPHTTAGRVFAGISMIVGFYVFATALAIISDSVHARIERDKRGLSQLRLREHIVLCDYTAVADEMIRSLRTTPPWQDRPLAVVTDLVDVTPYAGCAFVRGVPFSPEALRRANVEEAAYVFIFANFRFADPDLKTLHVAARVLAMNPDATVFVELLDAKNALLSAAHGKLVPMDSHKLIELVLGGHRIDPEPFLTQWRAGSVTLPV